MSGKELIARHIARPIAAAAPTDKNINISLRFIVPPERFSTCSVKTQTAGSAQTTTAPSISPVAIKKNFQIPPNSAAFAPKIIPSLFPAGIKPPFTPIKKIDKPIKLHKSPAAIFIT